MKEIKIFDLEAKEVGTYKVDSNDLIQSPHKQAIFDQVLAEDAGKRQGTHSTLTKAEVRGGGRKPVAQKHSGRARQGSIRNPHWVGGGVAFGPKPNRNYKLKINSKVSELAFKSALTLKLNENKLMILNDQIKIEKPSTKIINKFLKAAKINNKKILFVINEKETSLFSSIKNLDRIEVKKWNQVSTKDLLNAQFVIYQQASLNKIMEVIK